MKSNKPQILKINSDPRVIGVFDKYPEVIRPKLDYLRALVIEAATEIEEVTELEETLKWGEPSYISKKGTTIRMDWKQKSPNQYSIYFHCQSNIIATARVVFGDVFNYVQNRAIVFQLGEKVDKEVLKDCFKMALTYHSIKHLPLLGR